MILLTYGTHGCFVFLLYCLAVNASIATHFFTLFLQNLVDLCKFFPMKHATL